MERTERGRRCGVVFEHAVAEVEFFARKSAEAFVDELLPHAREKCDDWRTGALREEARLRRIQKKLADEIDRIRRDRVTGMQGRELLLEVDEPPEGLPPEPDAGLPVEPAMEVESIPEPPTGGGSSP
jgi:hypothetical protein